MCTSLQAIMTPRVGNEEGKKKNSPEIAEPKRFRSQEVCYFASKGYSTRLYSFSFPILNQTHMYTCTHIYQHPNKFVKFSKPSYFCCMMLTEDANNHPKHLELKNEQTYTYSTTTTQSPKAFFLTIPFFLHHANTCLYA